MSRRAEIVAALNELDLTPLLPGDTLVASPDKLYYADPDGNPFKNADEEMGMLASRAIRREDPASFHRAYFGDANYDLVVYTSYLGWNEQHFPELPPLVWETQIRFATGSYWQRRYVTRAAAMDAHDKIIATISNFLPLIRQEKGMPRHSAI